MYAAAVKPKVRLKCTGRRLTQSKERGGTTHEGLPIGSCDVHNTFHGVESRDDADVAKAVQIFCDGGNELYNVHTVLGVHHQFSSQLQLPDPSSHTSPPAL